MAQVNNVWGTNTPQWIPFWSRDIHRAFRFKLTAERPATVAAL
jgi:hypothetical protein